MTILLDIDGVLVTAPSWKVPEQLADNFMKFNEAATKNLAKLYSVTSASIVLTTTHRINFSIEKWFDIFNSRGLNFQNISKINNRNSVAALPDRATEIKEWVEKFGGQSNYLVIDDDLSINGLSDNIKERCILTKPLIGFDKYSLEKALNILKLV